MVAENLFSRIDGALHGELRTAARAAPGIAHPIRGLFRVAARMAEERSFGRATGVLARAITGHTAGVGITGRSCASRHADLSRRDSVACFATGTWRFADPTRGAARGHTVHGDARRVQNVAKPLHPAGGHCGWFAHRRQESD